MLNNLYTQLCKDFGVFSNKRTKDESEKLSNIIKLACIEQTEAFLRKHLPPHLKNLFIESIEGLDSEKDLEKYILVLVEFLKQVPHAKFKLNAWVRNYFCRVKCSLIENKKGK